MRLPKSDEGRFFSITNAFEPDELPELDPPIGQALIFILAVVLVTFVVVGATVVL